MSERFFPKIDGLDPLTCCFRDEAGMIKNDLEITRFELFWRSLRLLRENLEIFPTRRRAPKNSRQRGRGERSSQPHLPFIRRGGDGCVHDGESLLQCLQLARPETKIAAAQSIGAAEVNPCQLILRLTLEHCFQLCDALLDCLFVACQSAAIKLLDLLLFVRRGLGYYFEKEEKNEQDRAPIIHRLHLPRPAVGGENGDAR